MTVFDEWSRPNLARDGSVLPAGWSEISLAEVVVHRVGGEWGEDCPGEGRVQVRVVRGTEFRAWERDKAKDAAVRWILSTRLASRELRAGDIVIEISGGGPEQPVGRTLLIDQETLCQEPELPLICGNFCRLLRIHPALDPAFVHLALREKYLRGDIWEFQNQTTNLRNLQLDEYLDGTFLRVPPLAEQRRIVAAAEDLLARAARTHDGLSRAQRFLRKLRQAILAAGVEGRLTEDWRRGRSAAAPLAALLDSVFRERKKSFDSALEQAALDGSRLKAPINLDPGPWQVPEPLSLPELPPGWVVASLQDLAVTLQYGTSQRADKNLKDGVPVLRMGNIRDGKIDARRSQLKLIDPADEDIPRFTLHRGDILFNRTNSPELVGKAAVFDLEGAPMIFASYLVRITCDDRLVLPDYLCGWINSPWGRRWARTVRTDCVSQSNINATKLRTMPVPLPPLDEQREIVRRSKDASAFADVIEEALGQALGDVEGLTRAILEQAMRGDLVPTEAEMARLAGIDYEPGAILLDRVRADHSDGAAQKRRSRRRKLRLLTTEGVLAAIRRIAWGSVPRTAEELIAAVAFRLKKIEEPSPEMQAWLRDHVEIAVERRILEPAGDRLVAATPKIGRYDFEFLVDALGRALRRDVSYDRKQLNRTVASWLGYDQVTAPMSDRLDEVRQEAVRRGLLAVEGDRHRFIHAPGRL